MPNTFKENIEITPEVVQFETEFCLSMLTGTPRQIAWGRLIRHQILSEGPPVVGNRGRGFKLNQGGPGVGGRRVGGGNGVVAAMTNVEVAIIAPDHGLGEMGGVDFGGVLAEVQRVTAGDVGVRHAGRER